MGTYRRAMFPKHVVDLEKKFRVVFLGPKENQSFKMLEVAQLGAIHALLCHENLLSGG